MLSKQHKAFHEYWKKLKEKDLVESIDRDFAYQVWIAACEYKEKENATELLKEFQYVTDSTICSFKKNTIGHNELSNIRKKVKLFLEEQGD